jgi:hypothetical protein
MTLPLRVSRFAVIYLTPGRARSLYIFPMGWVGRHKQREPRAAAKLARGALSLS